MHTLERLRILAARELSLDGAALQLQTPLESLHIDSLAFVEFLFKVEEEFGIRISDERARSMRTIGDLERSISELLPAASGS